MIKAVVFDMYETLITLYDSPAYFSSQMAEDAGIPEESFESIWRESEEDRTTGKITMDAVIMHILRENGCFTVEKLATIMDKRVRYKKEVFEHMHPEIIPLMEELKKQGIKIGLISNCYSEEAMVIKESILFPYFDTACLSYDEGIKKPDPRIYKKCLANLGVNAEECLYIGDGGSCELEAAREIGMQSAQAVWYLKDGTLQPTGRMAEFLNIENPMGVNEIVQKHNVDTFTVNEMRKEKLDQNM